MSRQTLKADLFGIITLDTERAVVERDARAARWWTSALARILARREARALRALQGVAGVPDLRAYGGGLLVRSFIPGEAMHRARPRDPRYFAEALTLVRSLHRHNVVHNDLAKEPNWLVTPGGQPALVDFQLATVSGRRGRWFRMLAHDDLRHLLKHKRTYCRERLTARERRILATPSPLARVWMSTVKPVYRFVTRRVFRWADREGAGDR
ncbi:MAG: RIO1 family regulatory kinase/ATPase [Steroidobacteraceae bacterium]